MNTKRGRRLMETIAAGLRPSREKLAGLAVEEITAIYQADQQRLAKERSTTSATKRKVFRPRAVLTMSGKTITWRPQMQDNEIPDEAKTAIRELKLKTTRDIDNADFVLTPNVGGLEQLVRWRLYLFGGALITLDFLTSRGEGGSCLIFRPAVEVKVMHVWASAGFSTTHPTAYDILDQAIGRPKSRWSWFVGSNVEFLTKALRTKSLLGLVTQSEYNGFPKDFVQCMTATMFLNRVCTIAPESQTCESRHSEARIDGGRRAKGAP